MIYRWAFIFLLAGLVGSASQAAEVLKLHDVLKSAKNVYPQILAQQRQVQLAESEVMATKGVFDPALSVDGNTTTGYYDNKSIDVRLDQNTPLMGLKLFGGWRTSDGGFAVYDEIRNTTNDGEIYGGVKLPLLKKGFTDKDRTEQRVAKLNLEDAQITLGLTEVLVSYEASKAYWKWVVTGYKRKAYQNLLHIARQRQRVIENKIKSGARPEIDRSDNQQFIANRQALVVQAEQDFNEAALKLSLFYRDSDGHPTLPSGSQLPALSYSKSFGKSELPKNQGAVQKYLNEHPLLTLTELKIQKSEQKLRLAKNEMLPELDLSLKVSNDLGDQGPANINTQEMKAGVQFRFPLLNRKARGEKSALQFDLESLRLKYQLQSEKIEADLQNALQKAKRAKRRVALTLQQWTLARKIQKAEQSKFESGLTNLLSVNLREEYTAKARVDYLDALYSYNESLADFFLASARTWPD